MDSSSLSGKRIVLGIGGGIAAYKCCDLVRALAAQGGEVHVILTASAKHFVTPLTLQTLSGHPVHTELFDLTRESTIGHIELADRADAVVVAPATANLLARANAGICDDLLTTVICATRAPVLFCPAMNCNMWSNKITQRNIAGLKAAGHAFLDPVAGELACGWEGMGRLPEIADIVAGLLALLVHPA